LTLTRQQGDMRSFSDVSIKHKLMLIIMLTTTVVVLIVCAAFVAYDLIMLRRSMTDDLRALARIVGDNSTAALSFNNPTDAEGTLKSLRARPQIVTAYILTAAGEVFAKYPDSAPNEFSLAENSWPHDFRFRDNHLEVFSQVVSQRDALGTVYLKSDLRELFDRFRQYLGVVGAVILVSGVVAFILSSNLQRFISQPILKLASLTRTVSAEKNYAVRANKESQDEIGELIEGFNDMLLQIQCRDAELREAHDDLEQRVEDRTRELQKEIAERRETEEKLKNLAAKLQRSNRELQDFAYVASHDLQEPLRKVQAFAGRLLARYAGVIDEEGRDYLERMQNAGKRMQNLITDLLTFSRVNTQARPFEPVKLAKIVHEVLSDLEVRIQQTSGSVEVEELPVIDADPLQLRQLFQNLISNALKFHQPDLSPRVRIRSELKTLPPSDDPGELPQEVCDILVEDNGIGFDEKYLDRIFAVFQRLHGREVYEGTGIGLAICRKIVERHGGTITAKSKPGSGTTFIVTLPRSQKKETMI
jgi:signal transduction histidine kinase